MFFHWPHRHEAHGGVMGALCGRVLNNEILARRLLRFRTVRVEMDRSDAALAKQVGATLRPGFAVLDRNMRVVSRFERVKSAGKLARQLRDVFSQAFPRLQRKQDRDVAQQRQHLQAAKRLNKLGQRKQALHFVDRVRRSTLRIDTVYDEAVELGRRIESAENAETASRRK